MKEKVSHIKNKSNKALSGSKCIVKFFCAVFHFFFVVADTFPGFSFFFLFHKIEIRDKSRKWVNVDLMTYFSSIQSKYIFFWKGMRTIINGVRSFSL